jgi:hypothetical protein
MKNRTFSSEIVNPSKNISCSMAKLLILALVTTQIFYILFSLKNFNDQGLFFAPIGQLVLDYFMDFFNTNFFVDYPGKYQDWQSIYPPLVFLVAKLITNPSCGGISSVFLRDCDLSSIGVIVLMAFVGSLSAAYVLCRNMKLSILWWPLATTAVLFSLPTIYAIERANYIVICFAALPFITIGKNETRKSILLGLIVNIKQYLLILLVQQLVRRKLPYFLLSIFVAISVFVATSVIFDSEKPYEIFINMFGFATVNDGSEFSRLWYANSVNSFIKVFQGRIGAAVFLEEIRLPLNAIMICLKVLLIALTIALVLRLVRQESSLSDQTLYFSLTAALLMLVDNVNGYGFLLLLPFLAGYLQLSPRVGPILIFLILCPWDINLMPCIDRAQTNFLTGEYTSYENCLTLGSYIRPWLLIGVVVDLVRSLKNSEVTE